MAVVVTAAVLLLANVLVQDLDPDVGYWVSRTLLVLAVLFMICDSTPTTLTSRQSAWSPSSARSTRSGASGRSSTARPDGPAAYKTGTTSDNRDVAAYGYVAPPADKTAPALAVGVWMGNSDNSPNDGKLSLDTSAPLWSAILTEITKGEKIAQFKPPADIVTAKVDAYTGLKPGPFTKKTITEYFVPGTVPTQKETLRTAVTVDAASGLLWQDGCVGPKVTRGFFNMSEVEANFPAWQKADLSWAARAGAWLGGRGRAQGHPHVLLLHERIRSVRAHLGSAVRAAGPLSDRRAAADLRSVRADTGSLAAAGDLRPAPDGPRRRLPYTKAAARLPDAEADAPPSTRTRRSSPRRRPHRAGRAATTSPGDDRRPLPARRRERRPSPSRG